MARWSGARPEGPVSGRRASAPAERLAKSPGVGVGEPRPAGVRREGRSWLRAELCEQRADRRMSLESEASKATRAPRGSVRSPPRADRHAQRARRPARCRRARARARSAARARSPSRARRLVVARGSEPHEVGLRLGRLDPERPQAVLDPHALGERCARRGGDLVLVPQRLHRRGLGGGVAEERLAHLVDGDAEVLRAAQRRSRRAARRGRRPSRTSAAAPGSGGA